MNRHKTSLFLAALSLAAAAMSAFTLGGLIVLPAKAFSAIAKLPAAPAAPATAATPAANELAVEAAIPY